MHSYKYSHPHIPTHIHSHTQTCLYVLIMQVGPWSVPQRTQGTHIFMHSHDAYTHTHTLIPTYILIHIHWPVTPKDTRISRNILTVSRKFQKTSHLVLSSRSPPWAPVLVTKVISLEKTGRSRERAPEPEPNSSASQPQPTAV